MSRNSKQSVGVVIPFYNGSAFIERALISVFEQTVNAAEIVVVNDGSNQDESQYLRDLIVKHESKFRIIEQDNQGQGGARNAGVLALTSEFICFLDQDDYFLSQHIEDLLNAIPAESKKLGFVYADLMVVDESGKLLYDGFIGERAQHPKRSIDKLLSEDMYVLPSASIINKNAFLSIGGFDIQFMGYEDDDLFLRLFQAGFENYFLNKSVTVWYINEGSTTFNIRMKRSRYRYFLKLSKQFSDNKKLGRMYLRDCIIPRFYGLFIGDVIAEIKSPTIHFSEVRSFLIGFNDIVFNQSCASRAQKAKLSMMTFILTKYYRRLALLVIKVFYLIQLIRTIVK